MAKCHFPSVTEIAPEPDLTHCWWMTVSSLASVLAAHSAIDDLRHDSTEWVMNALVPTKITTESDAYCPTWPALGSMDTTERCQF
jgi:hypothetical protein